ncbi:MAG: hypothetical protein LBS69_10245 [Prevotellaceae bacterium]|jgi:hypothetical protein|nr:hypothetical protein [Prevotellaceae bacterium]
MDIEKNQENNYMIPTIFTTGAYLQPMKIQKKDGGEYWVWTVTEFIDDSFKDGKVYNPPEIANTLDDLLQYDDENEES